MNFVKYAETDFEDYYALVSNMEVMKQITERTLPEDEAKTQFQSMLDYNLGYSCGYYRISGEDGVGMAYAKLIPDESDPSRAEMGYMVLPEYWGQGHGTSIAARLILKAQAAGIGVLYAVIDPSNAASRQILNRQNFVSTWTGDMEGLPGEILELNLQVRR
ncbi:MULTISPECIES: GNAT family N-acetyltransferase [Paenibacillus]|uniref:GNAT family N-acetyltransferase n=1 Tax=Paenibacillus xylanilyticus TaxID=248903 RepID=A0A7Y6BVY9_9BACL|nr:GNAT family N-acetyltransferase [Paenibacillus xylanilyticus]NUU75917.1 GNAT family N-acetyltransferase [Paenibacillus xylanilyticus]